MMTSRAKSQYTLNPDGTLTQTAKNAMADYFYPSNTSEYDFDNQPGHYITQTISYKDSNGNTQTLDMITGSDFDFYTNSYDTAYPGLSLKSVFRDPVTNQPTTSYSNLLNSMYDTNINPAYVQAYKDSYSTFINTVEQVKANNGGKLPADFPQMYIDIYNTMKQ